MATVSKAKGVTKVLRPTQNIDAKKAVAIALTYFGSMFAPTSGANVMLEEIEESEDGKSWLVTIGYDRLKRLAGIAAILQPAGTAETERAYKVIKVNSSSGRVISAKIRKVD